MTSRYSQIDVSGIKTTSIEDRKSKVSAGDFAKPHVPGADVKSFIDSLPNILAGDSIRMVIDRIADAHSSGKPVVFAMGAHVIKCGLSPIVADLVRRGVITAIAFNGAGAIHDFEIASCGRTSEDVVEGMQSGMFGMARETAEFLNTGAQTARSEELGLGEALGRAVVEQNMPHKQVSLLAACYESEVPLSVHVCIGCDIVHMHPSADGAAIGEASMRDYRILTDVIKDLGNGGVLLNVGSAVVLPEVLLKAITTAINLGHDMKGMTGVNLDFMQHYRSNQQVVTRVKEIGGEGISLTGHHELMIPLIAAGVVERIQGGRERAYRR